MTPAHRDRPAALPAAQPRTRPAPLRELLLIGALWLAYSIGRLAADGHVSVALANADRIWGLERLLRLPAETDLQHLLLRADLVSVANSYYAYVHFPATIGFLLWVYLRRPDRYRTVRNTLALLTAAALVVHLIFPLAPPRMLAGTGLIDTGRLFGPSVYGTPGSGDLTNQYAAMPSLHVGWSLLVAITLIILTRGRWRALWLLHPLLTLLVVIGTANHYWLDALVAIALLLATARLTGLVEGRTSRPAPAGEPLPLGNPAPADGPPPAGARGQATEPTRATEPAPANGPPLVSEPAPANGPPLVSEPAPANGPPLVSGPAPADGPPLVGGPAPANGPPLVGRAAPLPRNGAAALGRPGAPVRRTPLSKPAPVSGSGPAGRRARPGRRR